MHSSASRVSASDPCWLCAALLPGYRPRTLAGCAQLRMYLGCGPAALALQLENALPGACSSHPADGLLCYVLFRTAASQGTPWEGGGGSWEQVTPVMKDHTCGSSWHRHMLTCPNGGRQVESELAAFESVLCFLLGCMQGRRDVEVFFRPSSHEADEEG